MIVRRVDRKREYVSGSEHVWIRVVRDGAPLRFPVEQVVPEGTLKMAPHFTRATLRVHTEAPLKGRGDI